MQALERRHADIPMAPGQPIRREFEDLAAKVHAYVAWYLKTDQPFHWSYRPKSCRA